MSGPINQAWEEFRTQVLAPSFSELSAETLDSMKLCFFTGAFRATTLLLGPLAEQSGEAVRDELSRWAAMFSSVDVLGSKL